MLKLLEKSLLTLLSINLLMASKMAMAIWIEPFNSAIAPSDVINALPDGLAVATTVIWTIRGAAVVAATILLSMCATRIHREDYYGALLTFIGALVAGASPYLSTVLFLG